MTNFEIIKCHGSGNDFIMVDTTRLDDANAIDWSAFARIACDRTNGIGSDGVLLVVRNDAGIYGMDMLNPDGTHAEMCGNGIRCVARLAEERGYLDSGTLTSGGRTFPARRAESVAEGIETFSVDIPIATWSPSFAFFNSEERFVGKVIENLNGELRFTALNLGNPHIVAAVEEIDMTLLEELGERVKVLKNESRGAKEIITIYSVLDYNKAKNLSLAKIELVTGRTHQIRAHMSSIGHPLLGDGKYGSIEKDKRLGYKHQALYAYKLVFGKAEDELSYLNGREFTAKTKNIYFLREFPGARI